MANNNKKGAKNAPAAAAKVAPTEVKKYDATKIFLIVFAIVALLGIVGVIVFGIVQVAGNKPLNYEKARLKKYISIDASQYKGFNVEINLDRLVDENGKDTAALEQAIVSAIYKLQYDNREELDGKNQIGQTIKVGDTANIYYYGYTLNDKGEKVPFEGGSNLNGSVTSLGIGSGNFIPGFEAQLVGKNSADYRTMTKRSDGVVNAGNIVTLTYSLITFDSGAEQNTTVTLDLSTDIDATFGAGFKELLIGATVGEVIKNENGDNVIHLKNTVGPDGKTRTDTYSDLKVTNVIEFGEGEPLTIDVTFPRPYQSAELEGKTVKFDVYIKTSVSYDTPEFNDEFITETLKVKAEDLADYEGANLAEKYRAKIRQELLDAHEESKKVAVENAIWEHLRSVVTVKKLPEIEVKTFYNKYLTDIEAYYTTYQQYYSSFDKAACDYLQISAGSDWRLALTEKAESAVVEKLLFYYIAREEKLLPSEAEANARYEKLLGEMVDSYLEQANIHPEDYKTEEEYNAKVQEYRDLILTNYGKAYVMENAIFECVMEVVITYATASYKA